MSDACCRLVETVATDPVECDARDAVEPGLPTVDVIARLVLALHRDRRRLHLANPAPELVALLDLCGLLDVVAAAGPPRAEPNGARDRAGADRARATPADRDGRARG